MSKKILIISPTFPYPTITGNRARIYKFLLDLQAMGHEVHFLYINTEPINEKLIQEEHWNVPTYIAPYSPPYKSLIKRIIRKFKKICGWESAFLYGIDDWYDNSLNEFILKLSSQEKFDVIIVEYVFFSKALECFDSKVLKIIDTHDIYTNRHRIYLKNHQHPEWYSTTLQEEAKGLNRANAIIAIQQKEKDFFARITNRPITVVGHTVSLHPPTPKVSGTKKILFFGASNPMNILGVNHFIEDVLPQITPCFPDVEIVLAGSICNVVEDFNGCIKLGKIENIDDVYSQADLVINPIDFGTGLKIKTIEALGYSKPLVTTSIGAEGLEEGINKAFLVADNPEQFANCIVKVFSDAQVAESLSKNAYHFARKWNEENLRELENILN